VAADRLPATPWHLSATPPHLFKRGAGRYHCRLYFLLRPAARP
jgi:hypothetical protein